MIALITLIWCFFELSEAEGTLAELHNALAVLPVQRPGSLQEL